MCSSSLCEAFTAISDCCVLGRAPRKMRVKVSLYLETPVLGMICNNRSGTNCAILFPKSYWTAELSATCVAVVFFGQQSSQPLLSVCSFLDSRALSRCCRCVGVWVCGCVGVWVCGCVSVCVGVLVCGCVWVLKHRLGALVASMLQQDHLVFWPLPGFLCVVVGVWLCGSVGV